MLDPEPIADVIVEKFQAIPGVLAAMNGDPKRIAAFHDFFGVEKPLRKAIYEMPAPGILVAFDSTIPGNWDGMTIFKHRYYVCMRLGNQAAAVVPMSYGTLWRLAISSGPVVGWDGIAGPHIRAVQIYEGLDIMDTPGVERLVDEDGVDYFQAVMAFPEIGDN